MRANNHLHLAFDQGGDGLVQQQHDAATNEDRENDLDDLALGEGDFRGQGAGVDMVDAEASEHRISLRAQSSERRIRPREERGSRADQQVLGDAHPGEEGQFLEHRTRCRSASASARAGESGARWPSPQERSLKSGGSRPPRILIRVGFCRRRCSPPTRACASPALAAKEASRSARTPPNALLILVAAMSGVAVGSSSSNTPSA